MHRATASDTDSVSPSFPRGMRETILLRTLAETAALVEGVSIYPGRIVFERIWKGASSLAQTRLSVDRAALLAEYVD